jgi:PAS domain S-box-containing protein
MFPEGDTHYFKAFLQWPRLAWTVLSTDGEIRFWSPGAEALFGYRAAEAEHRSLFELVVPPGRSQETHDAIAEALHAGHTSFESVRRRKDGSLIFVDIAMMSIADGRTDSSFIIANQRDITPRKQAEGKLRASEEHYRRIVETATEGIWTTDFTGATSYINRRGAAVFGYQPDGMVGRSPKDFAFPEDVGRGGGVLGLHDRGMPEQGEYRMRRKDGHELFIRSVTTPILGEHGEYLGALTMFSDITDQKRLRDELDAIARQRSEDLSRFALSIQRAQEEERRRIARELHDDLGQRLTGLKLKMDVLREDLPPVDARVAGRLREIQQGIEGLVGEIRRISSNLRPPVLDDLGLVAAVRMLCREFESSGNIKIRFMGDGVLRICRDAEIAIYRIAQEALSNVAQHAHARLVSIRLEQTRGRVRLIVEDDGKGMEPAQLRDGRRGLGLVGMNERARLLGGSVDIVSKPGHGLRLEVEIPAHEEEGNETDQDPGR